MSDTHELIQQLHNHEWVSLVLRRTRSKPLSIVLVVIAFNIFIDLLLAADDSFRNRRIHVRPFHPDKAGGLGEVGRFVANIGYGIGAMGLFLLLVSFQRPANSTFQTLLIYDQN